MTVRISEIFYSIQGEGRFIGTPSVFIRTSGCNLRCVWCDTPYTSWTPEGEDWTIKEVLREVRKYSARHIVITGGEPLLAAEIQELAATLKRAGAHITIETAATIFKPVACDLMSLSPKLANSTPWKRQQGKFAQMHEERRLNLEVIQKFIGRKGWSAVSESLFLPLAPGYRVYFGQIGSTVVVLLMVEIRRK